MTRTDTRYVANRTAALAAICVGTSNLSLSRQAGLGAWTLVSLLGLLFACYVWVYLGEADRPALFVVEHQAAPSGAAPAGTEGSET